MYKSCGGDFDKIYGEEMNGNCYFGKVIKTGHIYKLGYEKCTCPKVQSGQVTDPDQCNCSRQSIKGPNFGMNYGYLWYVLWHRHSFGSALGHRPWTDGRDTPRAHCRFRHGEKEHSEKRGKTK